MDPDTVYVIGGPDEPAYRETGTARSATRRRAYTARRNPILAVGAALTSVALHSLLLIPLVIGTSVVTVKAPWRQGAGASASASDQEPVMTLIQVQDSSQPVRSPDDTPVIASRGKARPMAGLRVFSPDLAPVFDLSHVSPDATAPQLAPEAAGNSAEHALMFGRYMGQVTERILRAWIRPRDPLDEPLFRCQVEITQGSAGDVKEVSIGTCNGDGKWQLSLVAAIQAASPLPAPPDPSVFSQSLSLTLDALPFHAGMQPEGYEPELQMVDSSTKASTWEGNPN